MMHFDFIQVEAIKSINQKIRIYFLKPMVLRNLKLHLTTARSSTSSGFNLALLGVTSSHWPWPHCRTENIRSDLDEAAGTGKTIFTSLAIRENWDSWCFQHLAGPRRTDHQEILLLVVCLHVVSQGFDGALANIGQRLNLRWWIFINKWWFVDVTFGWVVLAQRTLCNGAIKIVSKVSPNFGCLFLRNITVLLDGRHCCQMKR